MKRVLQRIVGALGDCSGAVTVDWVVLGAAVVGLGLTSAAAVRTGVVSLGTDIDGTLEGANAARLNFLGMGADQLVFIREDQLEGQITAMVNRGEEFVRSISDTHARWFTTHYNRIRDEGLTGLEREREMREMAWNIDMYYAGMIAAERLGIEPVTPRLSREQMQVMFFELGGASIRSPYRGGGYI